MNNLILILGMLMPRGEAISRGPSEQQIPVMPTAKLQRILKGMSQDQVVKAFGKPSRIETVHNFYSGKTLERFYYEDEPCTFHFTSCTVEFDDDKLAQIKDVKPEYL